MLEKVLISIWAIFFSGTFVQCNLYGQTDTLSDSYYSEIAALIEIDSIFISAKKKGFDTEEFIDFMIKDTSFYTAFRNFKRHNFNIYQQIEFFNKKNKSIATHNSLVHQRLRNNLRSNETIKSDLTGKYHKKNKLRYYTSRLINKVFYTAEPIEESDQTSKAKEQNGSQIENQIDQLKKVIFKPGSPIDVPIIGKKLSIFSEKMRAYYDYKLTTEFDSDSTLLYVFAIETKPEFQNASHLTTVKKLISYFDSEKLQVISRDYHFAAKNPLYKFDIKLQVLLQSDENNYYPFIIRYDGYWKVLGAKLEKSIFKLDFELLDQ